MALDFEAVAAGLLSCVCTALEAPRTDGYAWTGCECCIQPGSQASLDFCQNGKGQAWIVMLNGYPTTRFPQADQITLQNKCGQVDFATIWEIGVVRCVAVGDDEGNPPPCDVREKDAAAIFSDLQAVLKALSCCAVELPLAGCDQDDILITGFAPRANEGGCGGSTVTVAVRQPMPCCT